MKRKAGIGTLVTLAAEEQPAGFGVPDLYLVAFFRPFFIAAGSGQLTAIMAERDPAHRPQLKVVDPDLLPGPCSLLVIVPLPTAQVGGAGVEHLEDSSDQIGLPFQANLRNARAY